MQSWLSKRIASLSLAPALLLVLFIIFSLVVSYTTLRNATLTETAANLAKLTNAAVTELQKERGMSAGYIGSNGNAFGEKLKEQRKKVDDALTKVKAFEYFDEIPDTQALLLSPLNAEINKITSLRAKVDKLEISSAENVAQYSVKTGLLLNYNGKLVGISQNALGKQKFVLLYKLGALQEKSGLERALLSSVFGAKDITNEQRRKFENLLLSQQSTLNDLGTLSTAEFLSSLDIFYQSDAEKAIAKFRDQISNYPNQALTFSGEEWFSTATDRIGEIARLTDSLFDQLIIHAQEEHAAALNIVILDIVLLVLTFVLASATFWVLKIRKAQSSELQYKLRTITKNSDLTLEIEKISNDDLGRVTELTNDLICRFKDDLHTFQMAANDIASASHQSAASAAKTNDNIHAQKQSISTSLISAETLNIGINEDMESITKLAECASASSSMVSSGEDVVKSAVIGIRDTANEVKKVGVTIELLNEKVGDILKMVDVIRSVADQTNLLALNAAIEAARAGEQGRGFAVVADEVRALAKRTQESTEEIASVVDDLNESSNRAFNAIEVGSKTASKSVNLADEINIVLSNVASNMRELESLTDSVDQSAQQQSFSVKQITDAIREVDNVSEDNSKSSEQVASAAYQLSKVANGMLDNIKRYKVS
ncbi:methyl-accepting chemotaxis protein [Agaribacter marinus]|uniref:Methyl-accepting chemotaxis protein n=1 Tax=Agaribacter marinus TaxID=1431249 RepID=A0AA37WGT7_9ALTE|nr:methyl-accepting chemotaxis protein [Agaribacter marinus]GLR69257.1 methyl-accepting chemotaxis protein [Agaribacter marinus]